MVLRPMKTNSRENVSRSLSVLLSNGYINVGTDLAAEEKLIIPEETIWNVSLIKLL